MSLIRRLTSLVFKGVIVILPLVILGGILFWLVASLEAIFGWIIRRVAPELYTPGAGILLGLALSFVMGLLMNSGLALRVYRKWEQLLLHVPLVKTIYATLQDLASLLSKEKRNRYNRVVLVTLGDTGLKVFGFVTREDLSHLTTDHPADSIAVYLPMSYQIGGYLALVPRSKIESVDMSIEDASRLILTAAVSVGDGAPAPAGR